MLLGSRAPHAETAISLYLALQKRHEKPVRISRRRVAGGESQELVLDMMLRQFRSGRESDFRTPSRKSLYISNGVIVREYIRETRHKEVLTRFEFRFLSLGVILQQCAR